MEEGVRVVCVRIPDEMYRQLLSIARNKLVSVSDVIREALRKYLEGVKE